VIRVGMLIRFGGSFVPHHRGSAPIFAVAILAELLHE
jgi:hypothetical protein